ncbi:MAG: DUF2461 domain-containing protein [Chloroflexi bacterium]|nr:DUF2461 domain-containing protein [Chloroflexota bacterium]
MLLDTPVAFRGFQPELLTFFDRLAVDNRREWFHAHRNDYAAYFLEPARQFVLAMGELLPRLGVDIHAEPKVHGSILAITRDTRFSSDKTPYKTHLDLWFWQGDAPGSNRERPGYFLRLSAGSLILGAGMHAFSADGVLERYRQAVLDADRGPQLKVAAQSVGMDRVRGRTYKRVPHGLPADHPRADWLRHSGLYAEIDQPLPPELYTPALPELCCEQFARLAPLQQWLVDLLRE